MLTLHLRRQTFDAAEWRYRKVSQSDFAHVVKQKASIVEFRSNDPLLYYLNAEEIFTEEQLNDIRAAITTIKYTGGARTMGIKQKSLTFGYMPRNTIRQDYCRPAQMIHKFPPQWNTVVNSAKILEKEYFRRATHIYMEHKRKVLEKVMPDYRLPDSIFTSGIINKNCAMNYHTDTGNFPDAWSAMLVFKKNMQGGYLCLPELNLALECADATLVLFNGQNFIHGVSPLEPTAEDGYRISIVYYSLQQLCHCLRPDEERRRLLLKRTERERARLE